LQQQRLISIIVPLYNEAPNIRPLYLELAKHTDPLPYEFEMLFVDDGSTDDSVAAVRHFAIKDKRIRLLRMSRNFGKEAAMSAGLNAAKGDAAIIIDADLQMPPSIMWQFIEKWRAGAEVVVGVFAARSTGRLHTLGSRVFYRTMQTIARSQIMPHATDYRLLDRQVIDTFNDLTERNRITRGLIDWLGFHRTYVYFKQAPRRHGDPKYDMRKLINLAMDSFTAYSLVPLKVAGWLGILILCLSIPLGIFLAAIRFVFHDPFHWGVNGTTMLAVLILFLVGVILACLGLMSLYIAHIHAEVTNRPLYVMRDECDASSKEDTFEGAIE
jgi:polyisoprenyl-phosphate glycosyltransferase